MDEAAEAPEVVEAPYGWLRRVSRALVELDDYPLLGEAPPFPWDDLGAKLNEQFQLEGMTVTHNEWRWRDSHELSDGIGEPCLVTQFAVSPLSGTAFWVMSDDHVNQLMGFILARSSEVLAFPDQDYRGAFIRFAALHGIHLFQQLGAGSDLAPSILEGDTLPEEPALGVDITFTYQGQSVVGRFLLSSELRRSWKEHFTVAGAAPSLSALDASINVAVSVEGGHVTLSTEEWKQVSPGDFLVLDDCSIDPDKNRGRVLMKVNDTPLFRARIKGDKIKVVEYPVHEGSEHQEVEQ